MEKEEFKNLGVEWEKLNKEYDDYIQEFFDNPNDNTFTDEQIAKLKDMQQKLYDIESKWFKKVEGDGQAPNPDN